MLDVAISRQNVCCSIVVKGWYQEIATSLRASR